MSRVSSDDYDSHGDLRNGFDYELQVWVLNYEVQKCGHILSDAPDCCKKAKLAGLDIRILRSQLMHSALDGMS
ncbi:unnamed protein product [marine sediment metagenome]|uniref:Uncharacterized protein n=1 Tax=marine sediment metagenome TaxID=412755 RepID=X0T8M7_9ZZZZ